ncbi:hypothetical protein FF1_009909 [Malus domestica]
MPSSIALECKRIVSLLQRASISNLIGAQGAVNSQGEDQKKLDVVSNGCFLSLWSLWLKVAAAAKSSNGNEEEEGGTVHGPSTNGNKKTSDDLLS